MKMAPSEKWNRVILLVCTVAATVGSLRAQSPEPMTEAALRATAKAAVADASTNEGRVLALDARVKEKWGAFDPYPISLNTAPGLRAGVVPPYLRYRTGFSEALRKMEPIESVPFSPWMSVVVTPEAINAPDVIKVVVTRNGQMVTPVSSSLSPKEFRNSFGAATTLHAGSVAFPREAFAPGGLVVVTLIPESGENMVTPLKVEWLDRFK